MQLKIANFMDYLHCILRKNLFILQFTSTSYIAMYNLINEIILHQKITSKLLKKLLLELMFVWKIFFAIYICIQWTRAELKCLNITSP